MPRIRSFKPEFWGDEKLAPMRPIDRLVFLGLLSMADDKGRLVDTMRSIDGFIFPETEDSARESLTILAERRRILRYVSTSGQQLIQIVNWHRHQKVDNASKYNLPGPPGDGDDGNTRASVSRDSREDLDRSSRYDQRSTINDQRSTINETSRESREDHERERGARLASLRDRFFATFYGGATAERRAAVDRQLDEVLSQDGCIVRRRPHLVRVHATHATLANALESTLGEGVRKSDSAIVVVLKKLESGRSNLELDGDGRTQTEAMAVNHREVARVDAEDRAALLAEARAYAEQHPDAWGARRAMIEAEHPDPSGGDPRETWVRAVRQGVIDGALLAFYHERAGSGADARQSA